MTVQNTTSDKPTGNDIERYRANYLSEQEGVYLYSKLAEIESDAHLAELGVAGCVIGRALYEGQLDLKSVIAAAAAIPPLPKEVP